MSLLNRRQLVYGLATVGGALTLAMAVPGAACAQGQLQTSVVFDISLEPDTLHPTSAGKVLDGGQGRARCMVPE